MENDKDRVLDLHILQEMCSEPDRLDDPILVNLIALFLREEIPRMNELARLATNRNGPELARISHKLAGSCAVIGASQMYRAAQKLEVEAEAGNWDGMADRLAAVWSAWSRLQAALAEQKLIRK